MATPKLNIFMESACILSLVPPRGVLLGRPFRFSQKLRDKLRGRSRRHLNHERGEVVIRLSFLLRLPMK